MKAPDGAIGHAETELADGVIMLGRHSDDCQSPTRHGHAHQLVHVYVDDHGARAETAGAKIVAASETKPYGDGK